MTEHVRMFVGGDWVDAEDGAVFDAIGPSTGAVVGSVAEGTRGDAQRAIDAANRAWPGVGGALGVRPGGGDGARRRR